MATIKQKRLVEKIIENNGNVSKSMREVGYSESHSKNPQLVTKSKGFLKVCEESGLTDQLITDALTEDIKEKKGNRKGELELASKIKGLLKEKKEIDINGTINLSQLFKEAEELE